MNSITKDIQGVLTNFKLAVQKKGGYGYEEATQALLKLIAHKEVEARIEEAKYIFSIVWDEDGSPLQRDDPPKVMLDHLAQLTNSKEEESDE